MGGTVSEGPGLVELVERSSSHPILAITLRARVELPVTMLYLGRVVGDYGLSFMGKTEPAYGYRALIIPRGKH